MVNFITGLITDRTAIETLTACRLAVFATTHATGRWQANDEVDAALNYADYYYLEALLRCTRMNADQ